LREFMNILYKKYFAITAQNNSCMLIHVDLKNIFDKI